MGDLPVEDACRRVFHFILRRHDVLLEHAYFIYTDALASYKTGESFSRFAFRDSIDRPPSETYKTFKNL